MILRVAFNMKYNFKGMFVTYRWLWNRMQHEATHHIVSNINDINLFSIRNKPFSESIFQLKAFDEGFYSLEWP